MVSEVLGSRDPGDLVIWGSPDPGVPGSGVSGYDKCLQIDRRS